MYELITKKEYEIPYWFFFTTEQVCLTDRH
jgi:hypothetical protein